jgi:hypothetical protein
VSLPCLRCGDFVVPETAPVPGIELCERCLADARPAGPGTVLPPRELYWRQLWPILTFPLPASVAAFFVSSPELSSMDRLSVILFSVFVLLSGAVAGLVLGGVVANTVLANRGYGAWKATAHERLGVRVDPRFGLAYWVDRNQPLPAFNDPGDLGLLIAAPGGLTFLGIRGTRLALPFSRVRGAALERLRTNLPWRTSVRIDFDGGAAFFALLGATTYRRNRAEAVAAATFVNAWISASRRPSP